MTRGHPGARALVTIQTPQPTEQGQTRAQKRRRRRRRKSRAAGGLAGMHDCPQGVVSTPFAGPVVSRRSRVPRVFGMIRNTPGLADYTIGWLERHLDACGEYRTALDWGKVPDGAIPQSVSGQFRGVFTIRAPGQDPMSIPLDGQLWSLLIVSLNTWRTAFLLVADMLRSEVSQSAMDSVIRFFNNKQIAAGAQHPNWATTDQDGVYWSVVGWDAIANAPAPTALGISPFIEDFRITGEGFTVQHNTPSLINQGIAVAAQFNPNTETRSRANEIVEGRIRASVWIDAIRTPGATTIRGKLPGIASTGNPAWQVDMVQNWSMPIGNSSAIPVVSRVYNSDGTTILWDVGDSLRFSWPLTLLWSLQRQVGSTGAWANVITADAGATTSGSIAWGSLINNLVFVIEDDVLLDRANCLTLPPISQQGMVQATPKTVQFLLKEHNGIYVNKRVWKPVMDMTSASNYGPLRIINRDTTLSDINTSTGVFNDTFDTNYGVAVVNLSSLPLACAPYVKCIRSWEAVPSEGSPWGPFTTGTTPKDDLALVIARTVADLDPFAYPLDYNGLGTLFAKIVAIVTKIPKVLRSAANVAEVVGQVCEDVQASTSTADKVGALARGIRRGMVVQ